MDVLRIPEFWVAITAMIGLIADRRIDSRKTRKKLEEQKIELSADMRDLRDVVTTHLRDHGIYTAYGRGKRRA